MFDLVKSVSIDNMLAQRINILNAFEEARNALLKAEECSSNGGFGDCLNMIVDGSRYSINLLNDDWKKRLTTEVDKNGWKHLMSESGLRTFMDSKTKSEWDSKLSQGGRRSDNEDIPELTKENIMATFHNLYENRLSMFESGVLECFKSLSWNYKTNSPMKFGKKIIVDYFCSEGISWGFDRHYNGSSDKVVDLERVMHVLDGKPQPDYRDSVVVKMFDTDYSECRKTGEYEDEYFKFKLYKKGTAHIHMKRKDLVEKLNEILVKHYPDALASRS